MLQMYGIGLDGGAAEVEWGRAFRLPPVMSRQSDPAALISTRQKKEGENSSFTRPVIHIAPISRFVPIVLLQLTPQP